MSQQNNEKMRIAKTIVNQMGGGRFTASVDPRLTAVEPDYNNNVMGGVLVHIYHRQPKPLKRFFKVTLNPSDMYDIEVWSKKNKTDSKLYQNVFCDMLVGLFEETTGYIIL